MSELTESWSVVRAKARFSELIERARHHGPQSITRNGHETAVLVSAEEWARRTRRAEKLGDFFANSPLRGSGLDTTRPFAKPRDVEL